MSMQARVLVVEDDESILELAEETLIDEGYDVLTARNGAAALDLIVRSPPDVILLDLRMPRMDGIEFAQRYHAMPAPHAPIIVFSAVEDPMLMVATGVVGYLSKPFELDDLLAAVASACETHAAQPRDIPPP